MNDTENKLQHWVKVNKQSMDCNTQLAATCLFSIHAHFFQRTILTCKVGHTDLALCAAVTICSTLIHIQTYTQSHTHTHTAYDQLN